MPVELILDSQICGWVFMSLVLISFLEGILTHYLGLLIGGPSNPSLKQIEENQALTRARLLRENGELLSRNSFFMRKNFFNNSEIGYLVECENPTQKPNVHNMMKDPSFVNDMVKGNLTKVVPMLIGGGWINWMFSGFLTTKLPFPLPLRFKSMLQRGIELESLSPSWVSSVSWYFLNVFGLRSMYTLILNSDEYEDPNDLSAVMDMQMDAENKVPFKAEWEALEMYNHEWILKKNVYNFMSNLNTIK